MRDEHDLHRLWATAIDSLRRRTVPMRVRASLVEIPSGFVTLHPPSQDEPFASSNKNAACWYAPDQSVSRSDIDAAMSIFREHDLTRAYLWFGPQACGAETVSALHDIRASPVPWVTYPVLVRGTEPCAIDRHSPGLRTRLVPNELRQSFLDTIAPWYSSGGAAAAGRLADLGFAELHGVWIDNQPAAMAALIVQGSCGILGWAGTDPAHRRRGCQTALIRSRIDRVRELGLQWCLAETVTADMTSTNNLLRCGFTQGFAWQVWEWSESRVKSQR